MAKMRRSLELAVLVLGVSACRESSPPDDDDTPQEEMFCDNVVTVSSNPVVVAAGMVGVLDITYSEPLTAAPELSTPTGAITAMVTETDDGGNPTKVDISCTNPPDGGSLSFSGGVLQDGIGCSFTVDVRCLETMTTGGSTTSGGVFTTTMSTGATAGDSTSSPTSGGTFSTSATGGGPTCAPCADVLDGTAELGELCGTDPFEGLCSQDTPCQRYRLLRNCWCAECMADCDPVCPPDERFQGGMVDGICQACRDTASMGACAAEYAACEADVGD